MCHQILFSAIFQNQLLSHFICPFSYIIPHTRCILVNVLEVLHFCIATDVLRCTFHPSDIFNIILVIFFLYHLLQHKIFSLPWTPSNICLFWILLFYQNCPSFHCLSETTSSCCYLMEKKTKILVQHYRWSLTVDKWHHFTMHHSPQEMRILIVTMPYGLVALSRSLLWTIGISNYIIEIFIWIYQTSFIFYPCSLYILTFILYTSSSHSKLQITLQIPAFCCHN